MMQKPTYIFIWLLFILNYVSSAVPRCPCNPCAKRDEGELRGGRTCWCWKCAPPPPPAAAGASPHGVCSQAVMAQEMEGLIFSWIDKRSGEQKEGIVTSINNGRTARSHPITNPHGVTYSSVFEAYYRSKTEGRYVALKDVTTQALIDYALKELCPTGTEFVQCVVSASCTISTPDKGDTVKLNPLASAMLGVGTATGGEIKSAAAAESAHKQYYDLLSFENALGNAEIAELELKKAKRKLERDNEYANANGYRLRLRQHKNHRVRSHF